MLDPDISTADALRHLHQPDAALDTDLGAAEGPAHALDRRRFLQLVGMGLGAGALAGPGSSVLDSVLGDHADTTWAAGPIGPNDGILVVIGMYGGNDGLNTVVPITDGNYYDQHGNLAIAPADTLPLDRKSGLHPELTVMKEMWDRKRLAIVEGVGYPDADLSHFNSMAKWMAGHPTGVPASGWVGRWLDGYLAGSSDLFAAAEIGHSVPLHVIGEQARATSVPEGRPLWGTGTQPRDTQVYDIVRSLAETAPTGWSKAVGGAFADHLTVAQTVADRIPEQIEGPQIAAKLEVAARLVNADLGLRVLTVGYGDFDSHAGQPYQHTERMIELNAGLQRFYATLDPTWNRRVTVMTFSEFGRTSFGNDGQGTDHGTSAPHFVMGPNVKGGRYGRRPTLAGLGRWDRMEHHVDYRDYYGSVLDGWMGGGSSDIFGRNIEDLGLFKRGPGLSP